MADEQTTSTTEEQTTETNVSTSLQEAAFGDNEPSQQTNAPIEATSQQQQTTTETKETTVVEPFYKKLGFEKEDDVVNEITTLREKASKTPEEIKFVNEQSKQIHELLKEGKNKEVREFLQTQEQIDDLASLPVDKDNAADIIKLQMKLKNKQLSAKEIDFEYRQNFELPKEPTQKATEDDDEFAERLQEWKEKCEIVETKRVIAAKLAQPELTNFKSELVLPEIQNENLSQRQEPTQEELAAFTKDKETFLQSVQSSVNGFNGISVPVKDKDVNYVVNYVPSKEEKTAITEKLSAFAESGFDANALLAERWVSEDGKSIKIDQMVKDLSLIYGQENISQKLVTDSANKRMEAYLKEKKQINVTETNAGSTFTPTTEQSVMDNVREQAFA